MRSDRVRGCLHAALVLPSPYDERSDHKSAVNTHTEISDKCVNLTHLDVWLPARNTGPSIAMCRAFRFTSACCSVYVRGSLGGGARACPYTSYTGERGWGGSCWLSTASGGYTCSHNILVCE